MADFDNLECHVESRRARVESEGGRSANEGGELLLETPHPWAGRDPVRSQRRDHLVDFLLADKRRREGEKLFTRS
jgi:hypothetical protein